MSLKRSGHLRDSFVSFFSLFSLFFSFFLFFFFFLLLSLFFLSFSLSLFCLSLFCLSLSFPSLALSVSLSLLSLSLSRLSLSLSVSLLSLLCFFFVFVVRFCGCFFCVFLFSVRFFFLCDFFCVFSVVFVFCVFSVVFVFLCFFVFFCGLFFCVVFLCRFFFSLFFFCVSPVFLLCFFYTFCVFLSFSLCFFLDKRVLRYVIFSVARRFVELLFACPDQPIHMALLRRAQTQYAMWFCCNLGAFHGGLGVTPGRLQGFVLKGMFWQLCPDEATRIPADRTNVGEKFGGELRKKRWKWQQAERGQVMNGAGVHGMGGNIYSKSIGSSLWTTDLFPGTPPICAAGAKRKIGDLYLELACGSAPNAFCVIGHNCGECQWCL